VWKLSQPKCLEGWILRLRDSPTNVATSVILEGVDYGLKVSINA